MRMSIIRKFLFLLIVYVLKCALFSLPETRLTLVSSLPRIFWSFLDLILLTNEIAANIYIHAYT